MDTRAEKTLALTAIFEMAVFLYCEGKILPVIAANVLVGVPLTLIPQTKKELAHALTGLKAYLKHQWEYWNQDGNSPDMDDNDNDPAPDRPTPPRPRGFFLDRPHADEQLAQEALDNLIKQYDIQKPEPVEV